TLIGPPGVGKTELARQIVQLCQTLQYFTPTDPIYLEAVISVAKVITQIEKRLLPYTPTRQKTLVMLDSCELIENINDARKRLYEFLDKHEHLTILATSRRRFSDEEDEVKPLDYPGSETEPVKKLQTYPAIQLFLERVKK